MLLIGGGVGITPLRALFETIPAHPGELTLFYRASDLRDVIFRRELEQLAKARGARLIVASGRRADLGYDPLSAPVLRRLVPDVAEHDVFPLRAARHDRCRHRVDAHGPGSSGGTSTTSRSSSERYAMRRVILAAVSTVAALVLLLSFKTHGTTSLASPPAVVVPSATPASVASAAAPATTTTKDKSRATTTRTFTGDSVDTRYGPVQVAITVTNGKLTAVNAIDYPQHDPRDEQINSYAIPQLDKEALAAGSAKIDSVSGATFTTDGYVSSLQKRARQGRPVTTTALRPGLLHVEHCMGTVFSIDVRDRGDWTDAVRDVVALLHQVDAVFSTYRPDSELSRVRDGRLRLRDAHPDVAAVFELCARLQTETSGYFTAQWRDGIDPTGVVKGVGDRAGQPAAALAGQPQPCGQRRRRPAALRRGRARPALADRDR